MVFVDGQSHIVSTIDKKFLLGKERPSEAKPNFSRISISAVNIHTRQRMLDLSQHAWNNVYFPEYFQHTLLENHSDRRRDYLKRIRKYGTLLRASHRMFANELPTEHDEFIRSLGHLNDNINTPQALALSNDMHKRSQTISSAPQANMKSDIDFQKCIFKTIALAREGLQTKTLPFEEYHDVRKALRNLNNFVLLLSLAKGDSPELDKIYEYGAKFVTKMGDNLDKGLVSGKAPINVDESIRSAALTFLDVFTY